MEGNIGFTWLVLASVVTLATSAHLMSAATVHYPPVAVKAGIPNFKAAIPDPPCPKCNGTGKRVCSRCAGRGVSLLLALAACG